MEKRVLENKSIDYLVKDKVCIIGLGGDTAGSPD